MRVLKIQIEGFGPLVKREIGPLGPRVNVVVGSNETGKSALRAFIRTVLMGFPR
ncbi:MAG: AAA family ATPase, partial [Chloroflexi bacterium]|nr:AAA family ATPase [Chloroflexota bacterium]